MNWLALVALVVIAYLVGAFPSGVVWGKLLRGVDVRQFGSGKTGATNSLRTLGWQVSLLVFVSDLSKGIIGVGLPLLLSSLLFKQNGQDQTPWAVLACGFASVFGHNNSIFIGFKGGRGVSTGLGQVVALSFPVAILTLLIGVWVLVFTRYVSLFSIVCCLIVDALILGQIWLGLGDLDPRYMVWSVVVSGYIIFSHRDNIQRLLNGTERKLGQKAKPVEPALPAELPIQEKTLK